MVHKFNVVIVDVCHLEEVSAAFDCDLIVPAEFYEVTGDFDLLIVAVELDFSDFVPVKVNLGRRSVGGCDF